MSFDVLLLSSPWFMTITGFLVGACLGRLANRCIDVFPRHELLGGQLRAIGTFTPYENVLRRARREWHWLPIVGWLFPGNPLAQAGDRWRYATIELVNGLLLALLAWSRTPAMMMIGVPTEGSLPILSPGPLAIDGWQLLAPPAHLGAWLVRLLLHALLFEALLIASVIDLRRMIIPDGSTLPPMLLAVAVSGATGLAWIVPLWFQHTGLVAVLSGTSIAGFGEVIVPAWIAAYPHWHGLFVSLAGLVVGGGTVWAVRIVGHWALRREAMGFGDVILMALIGSVIGWQPVLVVFFLAPVCAIVVLFLSLVTGKYREFPYGPWLSLATVLLLVGWQWIWPAAGQFFMLGRYVPLLGAGCFLLLAVLLRGMRLIRGDEDESIYLGDHWTSADQLTYLSMENPAPEQGTWEGHQHSTWSGLASSRGRQGEQQWHGPQNDGKNHGPINPVSQR